MSANNVLRIEWSKSSYLIEDVDSETGSGARIGTAKTLEKAVRIANKYMAVGNYVEYNLQIKLKPSKI